MKSRIKKKKIFLPRTFFYTWWMHYDMFSNGTENKHEAMKIFHNNFFMLGVVNGEETPQQPQQPLYIQLGWLG